MLHAHSFKHLAVETPDHGWSFYRQVRAAKSLLKTTVIQKNFVLGRMPTACSSRSPSCSGPTGWKLLRQSHVSYFNLKLSKIECGCFLPHSLPLLLVWPANPANSLQSLGKWSHSGVPKVNFFRRNNLLMLTSNGQNFKTRTSFFIKFLGNKLMAKLKIFMQF